MQNKNFLTKTRWLVTIILLLSLGFSHAWGATAAVDSKSPSNGASFIVALYYNSEYYALPYVSSSATYSGKQCTLDGNGKVTIISGCSHPSECLWTFVSASSYWKLTYTSGNSTYYLKKSGTTGNNYKLTANTTNGDDKRWEFTSGTANGKTAYHVFCRNSEATKHRTLQGNSSSTFQTMTDNTIYAITLLEVAPSTITCVTTSLNGFTYQQGSGPSAAQSFSVSGSTLTANITVTAPTNYEVSTSSGSGYGSSVTLSKNATGAVAATTVYVRLKSGLSANTYNGSINITSTGATTKSISLSGSVTSAGTSVSLTKAGQTNGSFTLSNDGPLTTTTEQSITVTASPAAGYYLSNLTASNPTTGTATVTGSGNTRTITYSSGANGSSTITATFSPIWQLRGTFNSYDDSNPLTTIADGVASTTVTLAKNTKYMFQFYDATQATDNARYHGNNGNIVEDISGWTFATGSPSPDCKLFTGPAGSYTFKINMSTKAVQVIYPEVAHPADCYVYFKKWADWNNNYFVHWWGASDLTGYNNAIRVTKTYTTCGTDYVYFPILTDYTNFIVKDAASGDGSHKTGDLSSTSNGAKYYDFEGWKNFSTYTISFNSGGGSGTMTAISDLCPGSDQAITTNSFTRSNYTFTGWTANVDVKIGGSTVTAGTLIANGATIQDIQSNITLTAQWIQTPVITRSPSVIAFGSKKIDGSYTESFTVSGSNLVSTSGLTLAVMGSNTGMYSIDKTEIAQTSAGTVASTTVTVTYHPTTAGSHAGADVRITTPNGVGGTVTVSVTLSGTGQLVDTYVDLMHDNSDITETGNYSAPSMSTDDTGSDCKGTHTHFAGWSTSAGSTTVSVKAGDAVTADGSTYYAVWGDGVPTTTYEQLTSIASIDESAQYVLGIDGTGFHYSGTSSWGLTALPSAQTPLYYTLTKGANNAYFNARTTIENSTYYLYIPTASNNFSMTTTSPGDNIIIGTTQINETNYAVAHATTTTRHLRINGTSGLRSYAGTTGSMAFFYKVGVSDNIDYKAKCCSDAAVVTLSPSSQTVYRDIDGNAAATIGFSKTGGGSGAWGDPTVSPSGPTVTKDGSNINFSATSTGTYTVGIGFTETCEKTGSATVTVDEQPIITTSGTTTFSPTCGTPTAGSDITVNSRYLASTSITASITTSTGSGNFTISTDNSTFNTSNKTITGGTTSKATSHIYVRYEPTADETGSIAGTLTLTCGGKTETVSLSGTVTCGCNIRFTSAANLVQITAANGIWVQANSELALSGSYLKTNADNANVSIRAYTNNEHFQLKKTGVNGEGAAYSSGSPLVLATNNSSNSANGYTDNIGIVYKPAAHNTTETATLTVEVYRYNGSTVYSTATYTLYGRSLPENFVIAVNDGTKADGHWYAVPADMVAPWGNSCAGLGTYKPYPITVNNNTNPTSATSAPARAIYTAAARTGAVNTNPQTMSYKSVPLAGTGNYYLYGSSGSSSTIQNADNNTSEQQKWFLDVVDWTNKEYHMHLATTETERVLAYTTASGANSVGEYAANASTTKKSVYILPVSATCTYYAAPVVNCYAVDATNYTIQFDCDRTTAYEISTNSGSTWSDLTAEEITTCGEEVAAKQLRATLPWATYHGQTIQIRAKAAGGCQGIGSFTVPNPNVAVNAGTWMTMTGTAGYAFSNSANSITISGLASCGNQNVSVSCSNNDISASVNQSTGAVTISMTAGNATAGVHSGTLTFTLAGGETQTQTIQITLTALAVQTFTANGDYFSSNILCDNTGDISSSSVYPFALTYQCFNSDGTAATLNQFNSTDTKVTDLTTGADLTGSVTRGFNSAGTNIRYALNVQYSQFVPGHKYRITWINTGQVMCNSSGVPYQDCYYDFIFSKDCTKPTALEACPINKTSFTANWIDNTCTATNSTVTVYTKGTSTLVNDDFTSSYTGTSTTTFNKKVDGKYCTNDASNAFPAKTYGLGMSYSAYTPILGTFNGSLTSTDEWTITVKAYNGTSSSQTITVAAVASANVSTGTPTYKSVTINGASATSITSSSISSNSYGSVTFTISGLATSDRLFIKQSGTSQNFQLNEVKIQSVSKTTVATATPTCSAGHVEITGLTANTQYYYTVTNNGNTSNEMAVKTRAGNPMIDFRDNEENVITHVDLATAVGIPTSQTVEVYATKATICDLEDMITSLSGSGAGMFTVTADFSTWTFYPQIGTYYGDITITYLPTSPGDHTATYSISDNATTSNLTLNGTATGGQIEVVQWATHGLIVESYVIASGTPQVDSYVGALQANGTYMISDDGWDMDEHANEEITVEWGAVSENFRVPIIVNSEKNSSTLSSATSESTIVVGPEGILHINNTLSCLGLELYPQSKVDFSSGSLTAQYVRLYNNGDTWANFPSFDASGASSISVDNVYVDFRIDEQRFHYITLPFNVMTGDVVYAAPTANGPNPPALRNSANTTAFYVRQYDGVARETNNLATESTYNVNMPHIGAKGGNYAMTAGRGYMIGIGDQATALGHAKRTLRFPISMDASKWTAEKASSKVVGGAWVADGTTNTDARATNKGWNLVGNPFLRELAVTSTSGGLSTGKLHETGSNPMWEITDESVRYITIYDAEHDAFTYQSLASSFTLKPMAAFYLQMKDAKYINFQAAMVGQAAAKPSIVRTKTLEEEEVNVSVSLSTDSKSDKTGVVLHSKYDVAYNESDDADYPKLMSGTQLALWSIAGEEQLASNGLPKTAASEIPLGYQAPDATEYTFALNIEESDMKWLKHVWLTDLANGNVNDLLLGSYKFELTGAEKRSDRFKLGIELFTEEEVATDIENDGEALEVSKPIKFIHEGKMYIKMNGIIYDATGKRVKEIK